MNHGDLKNAYNAVALRISQIYIKFNINGRLHQFFLASNFDNSVTLIQ